jgi:hypothetical protein
MATDESVHSPDHPQAPEHPDLWRTLLNLTAASGLMLDFVQEGRTALFDDLDYDRWSAEGNRLDWLAERIVQHAEEASRAYDAAAAGAARASASAPSQPISGAGLDPANMPEALETATFNVCECASLLDRQVGELPGPDRDRQIDYLIVRLSEHAQQLRRADRFWKLPTTRVYLGPL